MFLTVFLDVIRIFFVLDCSFKFLFCFWNYSKCFRYFLCILLWGVFLGFFLGVLGVYEGFFRLNVYVFRLFF